MTRRPLFLAAICILGFVSFLGLTRINSAPPLVAAFKAVTATLCVWWGIVASANRARRRSGEVRLLSTHVLPALTSAAILIYWSLFWPPQREAVELMAAQVLFAYAFDILLALTRRDRYTLGAGPLSLVCVTNLFLRFHDEAFIWQFGMLAVGLLGADVLQRSRDGEPVPVVSPASLALAVASVVLIATKSTGLTWGSFGPAARTASMSQQARPDGATRQGRITPSS